MKDNENGFSQAKAIRYSMMCTAFYRKFYRRDFLYEVMEVAKMLSLNSALWFFLVFSIHLLY